MRASDMPSLAAVKHLGKPAPERMETAALTIESVAQLSYDDATALQNVLCVEHQQAVVRILAHAQDEAGGFTMPKYQVHQLVGWLNRVKLDVALVGQHLASLRRQRVERDPRGDAERAWLLNLNITVLRYVFGYDVEQKAIPVKYPVEGEPDTFLKWQYFDPAEPGRKRWKDIPNFMESTYSDKLLAAMSARREGNPADRKDRWATWLVWEHLNGSWSASFGGSSTYDNLDDMLERAPAFSSRGMAIVMAALEYIGAPVPRTPDE